MPTVFIADDLFSRPLVGCNLGYDHGRTKPGAKCLDDKTFLCFNFFVFWTSRLLGMKLQRNLTKTFFYGEGFHLNLEGKRTENSKSAKGNVNPALTAISLNTPLIFMILIDDQKMEIS